MKATRLRVVAAIMAVIGLLLILTAPPAVAFEPWNQRHYPGSTATWPMGSRVASTGTMTWQAADDTGWTAWPAVVARALDNNSADPESLARTINSYLASEGRGSITIREARSGEAPDMRQFAVSAAFMEAKCGAAWATACVYLLNAIPVPAYYKAALMQTYQPRNQSGVVRHETFHALARACDQYRGGCPLASTGRWESEVICTSNPDTLMDCASAAQTVTRFDYDTFVTAYPPTTPFLSQIPVPEWGQCEPYGGCWNNRLGMWVWVRPQPTVWLWDPNNHDGPQFRNGWYCSEGCP